jgi:hypothetical protein
MPMFADSDDCPVTEELIGRLYRSSQHEIHDVVSALPMSRRAKLAAFCYCRAHLREIGLAIAATCDLETLMTAGGRAGNFLFEQSRELPTEERPRSVSRHAKVTLASLSSSQPLDIASQVVVGASAADSLHGA